MGTLERRQREAMQRRKSIVDAARTIFWKQGYNATTMPQIARAAELAPGTLYLYFPSKAALYLELLLEGYDLLVRMLTEAADGSAASPERKAGAVFDAFMTFARKHGPYFDIIFFVFQGEAGGDWNNILEPQFARHLTYREQACKQVVRDVLIQAGRPDGDELAHQVDAIWSMLCGLVLFFGKDPSFDGVCAQARRMLLAAVLGGKDDRPVKRKP